MMNEIQHRLSPRDAEGVAAMRAEMLPLKGKLDSPLARASFDELMEHTPDAAGVAYERASVGGVPGVWARPTPGRSAARMLYLHGGAYMLGSAWAYRHFVGQFAARTGVAAFAPDYRLAPEHVFPAAIDDAKAAYRGLAREGGPSIAIIGDSAGGGLGLALFAAMHEEGLGGEIPSPRAVVAMSPWTDLTLSGDSLTSRDAADPLLTKAMLATSVDLYLHGQDARDPRASPLFGSLGGLAAVQIHVGADEILFDDAQRYIASAEAAGVPTVLHVWDGMTHVFPASVGWLEAADASLDVIAQFLRERLTAD